MNTAIRTACFLLPVIFIFFLSASCKKDQPVSSQEVLNPDYSAQWIHFDEENGLYNHVTDIEQSEYGIIYIASTDNSGLVSSRIIGFNNLFNQIITIDSTDSPYLLSKITSIGFDNNKLYMGAQFYSTPNLSKELLVYSQQQGTYSHFPASGGTGYDFENFYFNNDGLWYGTGNNGLINFDNGDFHEFDSGNSAIPYPNYVSEIFPINNTDFWFFTSNAMMKKTTSGIEIVRSNFAYAAMDIDSNNDFWLIQDFANTMTKLSGSTETTIPLSSELIADGTIIDLVVDDFDNIWIATGNPNSGTGTFGANGLFRYKDSVWTHYTPSNSQLHSLNLTTLTIDAQGNLWVGSKDAGAMCITKAATDE